MAEIVHAQSDPRLRALHSILMAGIQACGRGGKPMTSLLNVGSGSGVGLNLGHIHAYLFGSS